MSITRRVFLWKGALAVAGTAAIPSFLTRAALKSIGDKRLVVIFQRGAADGLNIVIPHGEAAYYAMRPSISIPRRSVIDLDGFFGLHPAMASLQPLWHEKHLAIVHATGSPHPTRSHLSAQDFIESGTPGLNATEDGWLNRALRSVERPAEKSSCRAVAMRPALPRILSGRESALALNASKLIDAAKYKPTLGAQYPRSYFGESLKQLAQLIKANLGVQVAFADIGGWDHHVNEGGTQGHLADILREFSEALFAFWIDLGDHAEDTVVVTMSEFGRTASENSNRGTDHGHGNVMLVMGGPIKGGRVYGHWPGLDPSQLYEGRDLAVTTDFRRVMSEVVHRHLGNKATDQVFPGFESPPSEFLGLLC